MATNESSSAAASADLLLGIFLEYDNPFEHFGEMFERFERKHKQAWMDAGREGDWGQSFRNAVGNSLESLVRYLVEDATDVLNREHNLGLSCTSDKELQAKDPPPPLDRVKRNLLIDYGEYGCHLPDADVVVYRRDNFAVVCVVSCKTSLRDRLKQTVYWKLKLQQSPITMHVRYSLVTLDKSLRRRPPPGGNNKNYRIAQTDLDATYVLCDDLTPHDRIKPLSSFENDLRIWSGGGGG